MTERFELFYQPIVGIGGDGRWPSHYELLLRMRDESRARLVAPDMFIPAAERYNLMPTLDRWVIHESLSKLADRSDGAGGEATRWRSTCPARRSVTIVSLVS